MSSAGRIGGVARLELQRLLRARVTFTLLLLVPALQVVLFGYAIRPDAASITVAIAAPDVVFAQQLAAVAQAAGSTVVAAGLAPGGAEAKVRERSALVGLEAAVGAGDGAPAAPPSLRIVVDGTNAALTEPALARIEAAFWRTQVERTRSVSARPRLEIQRLHNPDGLASWTFLPALAGVTVMIAMIMLGSLSLARERESGSWETLLSLPIRASEVLLGKLLPAAMLGVLQGVLVLAAGFLLFGLPLHPSVLALLLLLPLFAATHFVLGYAIAARAATQLAGLQGAIAFYLPAMLLSGFLYPFESLPGWARGLGNVFPLTHFIRAAHSAVLCDATPGVVLAEGVPMLAFAGAAVAVAMLAHARRID